MPLLDFNPFSDQIKSFMDSRHYDHLEVDVLSMPANTNGETTWYIDGTNGDDSYDGLYPDNAMGGSHGPFKTISKLIGLPGLRYGERVLIRTGVYEINFGTTINLGLTGTIGDDNKFVFAPYGDGEVVFDFNDNRYINPFESLEGNIYHTTYPNAAFNKSPQFIIMDWTMRNSRQAKRRYGNDNSGTDSKTTSMTDTRRDFTYNVTENQNISMDVVGGYIYNLRSKSYGIITSISTTTNPNDTLNFSGGLSGGSDAFFNDNDPYVYILFEKDGDYCYIENKKTIVDDSGVNGKTTWVQDSTQDFSGYEGGMISFRGGVSPITSITTTTNNNDTINFPGIVGGPTQINNNFGYYQWQDLSVYKRISAYDINGTADTSSFFPNQRFTDSSQDFTGYEGAIVMNITDGSFSQVTRIDTSVNPNDTIFCQNPLKGGVNNVFNVGDTYLVYRVESSNNILWMRSDSGNPDNRNFKFCLPDISGSGGLRIFGSYIKFYGISFICTRSIGLLIFGNHIDLVKCRFMWCGKHGVQGGDSSNYDYYMVEKCFVYQTVLNNWPRGSQYGGNGGWPQAIQLHPRSGNPYVYASHNYYDGCIVYDNGGEGIGYATEIRNCMVIDNYSMNIYVGGPNCKVYNCFVAFLYYSLATDQLEPYYLQDFYNGVERNRNKMHPNGITMSSEKAGDDAQAQNQHFYNNIVVGNWMGIRQYFETQPNGMTHSYFANNTIILPYENIEPQQDFYAGIRIAMSTADLDSFVKNNIVICQVIPTTGSAFELGRMNLCRAHGSNTTHANIDWDSNLYSYPSEPTPFTYINTDGRTFAEWKAYTGWDGNTLLTDTPGLSSNDFSVITNIFKSDLKLLSSSVGRGTGENLSSFFTTDFDGKSRPSSGVWDKGAMIYDIEEEDYTKEAVSSLPEDDTNLANEFTPLEVFYTTAEDDRRVTISATQKYGVYLFKKKPSSGNPTITIKWVGKTNIPGATSSIYLQVYNRNSASWETLATNSDVSAGVEFTMLGSVLSDLNNYYDSNGYASVRVYQQAV